MAKADQVLRFAVGRPDEDRSATWRLWVPRGKSDVYLSRRIAGRNYKVSLHESGDWHVGLTSDYIRRPDALAMPHGNLRGLTRWKRPSPQPRLAPATQAFSIVIPWLEVERRRQEPGPVISVTPPPTAHAIQFDVMLVPSGVHDDDYPLSIFLAEGFVGEVNLANGGRAFVVWKVRPMTTKAIGNARRLRAARETPDGKPVGEDGGGVLAFGIENGIGYLLDTSRPDRRT